MLGGKTRQLVVERQLWRRPTHLAQETQEQLPMQVGRTATNPNRCHGHIAQVPARIVVPVHLVLTVCFVHT